MKGLMGTIAMAMIVLGAAANAGEAPAPRSGAFKDGDRVAFFGDSITARPGACHNYLADYYLTRYPEADIRFINCGSNGDGASPGYRRIGADVAARRPTVVVVMFGMNDVGRNFYAANATEQQLQNQEGRQKNYAANLELVLQTLAKECPGAAIYLATPSPFDENTRLTYANKAVKNPLGVNSGLGRCAATVRALAAKHNVPMVDFYGAINQFFRERRAANPETNFSLDRVHPESFVKLMMALKFLAAQNADGVVSDIAIQDGRVAKSINAEVSDVAVAEDGTVSFTVREKALPMPFAEDCATVAGGPEAAALNQEVLTVYSLAEGDWTLFIDGQPVATASAWEWENGVNLAFNRKTPQHAQAQKVLAARREATDRAYKMESEYPRIRRELMAAFAKEGKDPSDPAARAAWFDEMLPKVAYDQLKVARYKGARDEWDQMDAMIPECDAAWPRIRALAKPTPHKYELKKETGK